MAAAHTLRPNDALMAAVIIASCFAVMSRFIQPIDGYLLPHPTPSADGWNARQQDLRLTFQGRAFPEVGKQFKGVPAYSQSQSHGGARDCR